MAAETKSGKNETTPAKTGRVWKKVDRYDNADKWEPKGPGDVLEGQYVHARELEGESGKYVLFFVKTDDGKLFAIAGYQVEVAFKQFRERSFVRVEFAGEEKLNGGRRMKKYDIQYDDSHLPPMKDATDNIPF